MKSSFPLAYPPNSQRYSATVESGEEGRCGNGAIAKNRHKYSQSALGVAQEVRYSRRRPFSSVHRCSFIVRVRRCLLRRRSPPALLILTKVLTKAPAVAPVEKGGESSQSPPFEGGFRGISWGWGRGYWFSAIYYSVAVRIRRCHTDAILLPFSAYPVYTSKGITIKSWFCSPNSQPPHPPNLGGRRGGTGISKSPRIGGFRGRERLVGTP